MASLSLSWSATSFAFESALPGCGRLRRSLRSRYAIVHGMFDWDDARFFLAIARAGSVSGAGRNLRVQQSTVSRRLAGLEETLGARLFERTPDGYILTPAGESLHARAER